MPLYPHQQSAEYTKSELELFSLPPTQVSIEETKIVPYHPLSAITDNSPIEFLISGKGEDYLDLARSFMHLKVQVQNANGTPLQRLVIANAVVQPPVQGVAQANVAPINLIMHSMFLQIDVMLNDHLMSASDNCYAFKSYLETLLCFGQEAKESHLITQGWIKDEAGHFDDHDPNAAGAGSGLRDRRNLVAGSRTLDLYGRLHCDIFGVEQLLIPGVDVRLKLTPNKASFCLMSPTLNPTFKIHIVQATFEACKVTPTPSIRLAHEAALNDRTIKFPMKHVEMRKFNVAMNQLQFNQDNAIVGQIPDRIIIGLVDTAAYNGSWTQSPFNFQHFYVNNLVLSLDGKLISPCPLKPDFDNASYTREYLTLFQATGRYMKDEGLDISYDDYDGGNALYAFDLTPDSSASGEGHLNLVKTGSIRLEINFSQQLTAPVNVLLYAEYQTVVEIDKSRTVITEF